MYYKNKGEYFRIFNDGRIVGVQFFPDMSIRVYFEKKELIKYIKQDVEHSTKEEFDEQFEKCTTLIRELE